MIFLFMLLFTVTKPSHSTLPSTEIYLGFFKICVLCSWHLVYVYFELKIINRFSVLKANHTYYYLVFHFHVFKTQNKPHNPPHRPAAPNHQPQPPPTPHQMPQTSRSKKPKSPAADKRWCLLSVQATAKGSHSYRSPRLKMFRRNNPSTFVY